MVPENDKKSMMSLDEADVTSTVEVSNAQGDPELVNVDEKPYIDGNQKAIHDHMSNSIGTDRSPRDEVLGELRNSQ